MYAKPGGKLAHVYVVEPADTKLYSAWMYDREEGWCGIYGLSLVRAVSFCKNFKNDWGPDTVVTIVPEGDNPRDYFRLLARGGPMRHLKSV